MPEQFRDVAERRSRLAQTARKTVPQIVPPEVSDSGRAHGGHEPMRRVIQRFSRSVPHNSAGAIATGVEDHERLHCVSVQRNMHGLSIFRSRDSGDSRSKVYVFPHETLVHAAASQSGIQSEGKV